MWMLYMLVAVATLVAVVVRGYSDGAGAAACTTLLPEHDSATPQTGSAYMLTADSTTYSSNEEIIVILQGISFRRFNGFIITAINGDPALTGTYSIYHWRSELYLQPGNRLWAIVESADGLGGGVIYWIYYEVVNRLAGYLGDSISRLARTLSSTILSGSNFAHHRL